LLRERSRERVIEQWLDVGEETNGVRQAGVPLEGAEGASCERSVTQPSRMTTEVGFSGAVA